MTSEAKIAANRRNAEKSTGPRTAEGKQKSSRNALKYGLTAASVVIFDESEAEYKTFRAGIIRSLEPVGEVEAELACRIADAFWTARRSPRAEAGLFNDACSHSGGAFIHMSRSMMTFMRYSSAKRREIQMCWNQLERLQARRRGEAVTPPMEVNVSGSVEAVTTPEPSIRKPSQRRNAAEPVQISLPYPPAPPKSKVQEASASAEGELAPSPSVSDPTK